MHPKTEFDIFHKRYWWKQILFYNRFSPKKLHLVTETDPEKHSTKVVGKFQQAKKPAVSVKDTSHGTAGKDGLL